MGTSCVMRTQNIYFLYIYKMYCKSRYAHSPVLVFFCHGPAAAARVWSLQLISFHYSHNVYIYVGACRMQDAEESFMHLCDFVDHEKK